MDKGKEGQTDGRVVDYIRLDFLYSLIEGQRDNWSFIEIRTDEWTFCKKRFAFKKKEIIKKESLKK